MESELSRKVQYVQPASVSLKKGSYPAWAVPSLMSVQEGIVTMKVNVDNEAPYACMFELEVSDNVKSVALVSATNEAYNGAPGETIDVVLSDGPLVGGFMVPSSMTSYHVFANPAGNVTPIQRETGLSGKFVSSKYYNGENWIIRFSISGGFTIAGPQECTFGIRVMV